MRKKLQLYIPSPCQEDWNNMRPAEKGRFCASCQKSVIDFTMMRDGEIIQFFTKPSTASVCGRLSNHQLDRTIEMPRKTLPWVKYFFRITLPAFLISMKTEAQKAKVAYRTEVVERNNSNVDKPWMIHNVYPAIIEIKGKVIDDEGLPVSYSTVLVKGTKNGAVSDSSGNFTIRLAKTDSLLTLVASSIGFQPAEREINLFNYDDSAGIILELKGSQQTLEGVVVAGMLSTRKMGGLMVVSSIRCSRSLKDTITSFFNKFSVYPNPVAAGHPVTIENRKLADDNYVMEIISMAGQTIYTEMISIKGRQRTVLNIPAVAAGSYVLKLTGKNAGKTFSEKIIIQ